MQCKAGLSTYDGSAPAVLLEVERNGLSSNLASGVMSIDGGQPVSTRRQV